MRIVLVFAFFLNACSLYKSPDRKDFESDQPAFSAAHLSLIECSNESVKPKSDNSKIVRMHSKNNNHRILWEHTLNGQSIFETDDLNGNYCLYENN